MQIPIARYFGGCGSIDVPFDYDIAHDFAAKKFGGKDKIKLQINMSNCLIWSGLLAKTAALLYGILHKTQTTVADLEALGLDRKAIDLVIELTPKQSESPKDFLKRIADGKNKEAIAIEHAHIGLLRCFGTQNDKTSYSTRLKTLLGFKTCLKRKGK